MRRFFYLFFNSPAYVAPELITGDPYMGAQVGTYHILRAQPWVLFFSLFIFQADMWSLGILLYVFVAGSLPFNDDDVNKLFRKIQRGVYDMPKNLSPDLKNLIRDLLQLDPTRRIKMSSLIGHRWVMGPYGVPVKVCFAEEPEIDLRILDAMSPAAPMRRNEMIDSVRNVILQSHFCRIIPELLQMNIKVKYQDLTDQLID
jgi:serine/threonine protein kinase